MILSDKGAGRLLLAALGVALLIYPATAAAHRVTVFAWVEGNTIHTESKFSGGRVVKDGKIVVYDNRGDKLLDGRTDDAGQFSFDAPGPTTLRIELLAGTGHGNKWVLTPEDFGTAEPAQASIPAATAPSPEIKTGPGNSINTGALEQAVEQAVDRKLQPMIQMLVRMQDDRPRLRDIVGGIGYILGLIGVGMAVHYRRKLKEIDRR